MKLIKIIYYLIFLINTQYKCEISPIVITPKKFHLNSKENIVIISDKSDSINVTIKDYKTHEVILNKKYDVIKDEPLKVSVQVVNVSVPVVLSSTSSQPKVIVSVISNGSNKKSESLIKVIPKFGYAFIQTDKPIYTPKENVLIRVLRLDDRLKPVINERIKLRIKNCQKIIIEETTLESSPPNYFVDHTFEFPPAPKLGIWFAELWYGANYSSNSNVSFEVKEYVLPTFSIKIKSPKFILESSKNISGSVQVDYVYGKPVNGTVVFKFGTKAPNGRVSYFGSTSVKELVNGSAQYYIDSYQFRQTAYMEFPALNGYRFMVEVSVHEKATGKKDRAFDETGIFATTPYVISYKNTFYDFKPNIETYITAQINNILGENVADLPIKLTITDNDSGRPLRHTTHSNITSMQLVTDHSGRISFPITVENNVKSIHVSIRTDDPTIDKKEQAESAHILWGDDSTGGFIHISSKSKYSTSLSVGDTYRSLLITRGAVHLDKIYQIVVNRGNIILSERIISDKGIKLEITHDMTPFIRIMVLAVTKNDELISDSIKIDVNEDNCGFDMKTENNMNQTIPGKNVNLILNGTKGDSVGLLAVDEAVYILRKSDTLTKSKLMNELGKSDLGCGPGTGLDVNLVANNVGLKIISGGTKQFDDSKDDHCIRRELRRRRKKRDISQSVIETGFLHKCCLLGMWPSNTRRNCEHKATILKTYMPQHSKCYEQFLRCCKANSRPIIQLASTAKIGNNFDRNRIGSETLEYVHIAYEQILEDKTLIRNDFRESWLFDIVTLNHSNSNTLAVTFPHSITTWSITAMSISPINGFCIMSSPLRVRTFQDIFLQISLPYSVIQNEQMEMIVTVFNYGTTRLPVLVYTYGVEDICSEAESVGDKSKKHLVVDPNSFSTVPFPMVPLKTGTFEIKIVALWASGGDIVVKKLYVIPPGITVEEDVRFKLDPKNRQRRTKRSLKTGKVEDEIISENSLQRTLVNVEPDITRNIVPGTRECIIAGIGNEYGATSYTTLSDIDRLIRQPKGCGEQTMFYMAPTLYTLKYLQSIERLNGDLKYRGLKYIRNGYKRQLSFRKEDGSFSAFPARPSSIWLTSFVIKVFCQASPFLRDDKFDPKVIESGLNWLMNEQKKDGSWTEKHVVVHEDALGGVKGSVALTAYVLISFHECKRVLKGEMTHNRNLEESLNKTITKSERYLQLNQNEIIIQKNTYAMALVAYSLTFTNSQNSLKLIDSLHSMANVDTNRNYKYWRHNYEVEATAYALMAMLNSGNKNSLDGISITNWLNSVRSYSGAFSSTQDTVVALEALSQYIERQRSPTNTISLLCNITTHDVTSPRFKRALEFNSENALILQTFKLDSDSSKLKFTTTGEGTGQMVIKLKYNVFEPPEVLCRFDLSVEVSEWKASPESRLDDPNTPEIDDNFFNDFNSDMVRTLDLKHTNRQKRSLINRDNRQKRFVWNPWNRNRSSGRRKPSVAESVSTHSQDMNSNNFSDKLELNSDITDSMIFKKNNLSSKSIVSSDGKSKLILLVETCIRHIPRYYSDMSLIEVGLFSGYKPNKDDLEEIIKMDDSLVSKYEISDRNIVFYFEKVPFGRPYCLQFRKIQEHNIGNAQAAMVKVYDYYRKDHSCSQLFTPSRISDYIETKCNSEVCECAKRENCPTAKSLLEIGKIAERIVVRARQLFKELVCSDRYNFVFTADIDGHNKTQSLFKFLNLKVNFVFKGNLSKNDKFVLTLNPECNDESAVTDGNEVLIFGYFNEKIGHLNGSSIVYDISNGLKGDETRSNVISVMNNAKNDIKRFNWKCNVNAQT
ncbi:complement C3-like [Oppia nitens]|uniref:complement C3-like n=1 Tax=Oppia nitens TaxID=1686743 RepID=UPI0023D9A705|nr:complement C3-like [Oppia nitens]